MKTMLEAVLFVVLFVVLFAMQNNHINSERSIAHKARIEAIASISPLKLKALESVSLYDFEEVLGHESCSVYLIASRVGLLDGESKQGCYVTSSRHWGKSTKWLKSTIGSKIFKLKFEQDLRNALTAKGVSFKGTK